LQRADIAVKANISTYSFGRLVNCCLKQGSPATNIKKQCRLFLQKKM